MEVKRRVAPPPRGGEMLTFRPSFPTQITQETGKRPNGVAAAILAIRPPRSPRHDYCEGIPRLGAAAAATSYANVLASGLSYTEIWILTVRMFAMGK